MYCKTKFYYVLWLTIFAFREQSMSGMRVITEIVVGEVSVTWTVSTYWNSHPSGDSFIFCL